MPLNHHLLHLLLLEDNPDDVFLFKAALKRVPSVKCDIVHADRLSDAIELLQKQAFDLAVTDLNVPDSLGLSTLKSLLAHADGVPIIALTGWGDAEMGTQLIEEGAVCYLSKDRLDSADLTAAILKAVTQRQSP